MELAPGLLGSAWDSWWRWQPAQLPTTAPSGRASPMRLHDLRHACATFLLVSGASPRTVMKVLGHSQIGLTMNTYAHVLPEIERAAVDEAAKHLFG
ncbi:tyrosine-type recombinase/integrase [Micromonospora vinacea]|uniref:tyrosine-type recombinase/integrase n=1 Tax=Micromonospora TaxID=1873 RepID=UPI0038701261|nr:tyrosine-type recombinase/integrase [Micromonospora sp. NBC_00860]WTA66653.1 tyrosine-type recombinase/integrase [Micromonospora sp. NBC_00855]